ncbi:MAG TPA: hypothetical protein VK696_04195 [Steroidobacteraceae bacterium]|nr:hypothetical protein [Steroidobacteraceae bacterium]
MASQNPTNPNQGSGTDQKRPQQQPQQSQKPQQGQQGRDAQNAHTNSSKAGQHTDRDDNETDFPEHVGADPDRARNMNQSSQKGGQPTHSGK